MTIHRRTAKRSKPSWRRFQNDRTALYRARFALQRTKPLPSLSGITVILSHGVNKWTTIGCALFLSAIAFIHVISPSVREEFRFPFADTFTLYANTGIALAGTILGFLIAGFAILCTILRPQTMIALQRIRNREFDCSELRLVFLVFVDVIIQFLALLFWSTLAMVLGGPKGIAAGIGAELARIHWMIPFIFIHALFVAWSVWLLMLAMSLKVTCLYLYDNHYFSA